MRTNLYGRAAIALSIILTGVCHFAPAHAEVPEHDWIEDKPPVELTRQARYFIDAEIKFNPASADRSTKPFWIPHLEIPLQFVTEDKGLGLNPDILESMTFEKNGQKYVRWVMNPEDTQFNEELRQKLTDLDIPFEQGKHYIGYLTSSRSCLIQDPKTGVIFSIKSSTNQTAGNWKDKKETPRAAKLGRMLNDYLIQNDHSARHKELGIIKEPLAFYFGQADQAIIVRQYDNFNEQNGKYLVPLFSIFHERFGKELAEDNGAVDAEKFWFEKLGKEVFAKVIVKLALEYGITFNSPHGQNFLVEIDGNRKPTGKIFIRDYTDAIFFAPVLRAQGGEKILEHTKNFKKNWSTEGKITSAFNPFFSGFVLFPTWIKNYDGWKTAFQNNARGLLRSLLFVNRTTTITHGQNGIWNKYWNVETEDVRQTLGFKAWMRRLTTEHTSKKAAMCKAVFVK